MKRGVKAKKRGENASGYCNQRRGPLDGEAAKTIDPKKRYEVGQEGGTSTRIAGIPLALSALYTFHKKVRGSRPTGMAASTCAAGFSRGLDRAVKRGGLTASFAAAPRFGGERVSSQEASVCRRALMIGVRGFRRPARVPLKSRL